MADVCQSQAVSGNGGREWRAAIKGRCQEGLRRAEDGTGEVRRHQSGRIAGRYGNGGPEPQRSGDAYSRGWNVRQAEGRSAAGLPYAFGPRDCEGGPAGQRGNDWPPHSIGEVAHRPAESAGGAGDGEPYLALSLRQGN